VSRVFSFLRIADSAGDHQWPLHLADSRCVQYFDGVTAVEEMSFHTGMNRGELEKVIKAFPEDVSRGSRRLFMFVRGEADVQLVTFLHP